MSCDCDNNEEWVLDTGATHHITKSKKFMYNIRRANEKLIMGNGDEVVCKEIGDVDLEFKNSNEKTYFMTLRDINYIPSFWCNLLSGTLAMADVMDMFGKGKKMRLVNNKMTIEFYKNLNAEKGFLCAMNSKQIPHRHNTKIGAILTNAQTIQITKKYDINTFHKMLGHSNYPTVVLTAKHYEIKLVVKKSRFQNKVIL